MFKNVFLIWFLLLLLPSLSYANDLTVLIDDLVKEYEKQHYFQGSVLIKEKSKTLYSKSFGFSRVESRTLNTIDSKFMIASLTKSFTAAAILHLEKEGALSLEDSVSKYIKLNPRSEISKENWAKIKIKNLLNHTSGLIRDFRSEAYLNRSGYNDLGYILSVVLNNKSIIFNKPGEKFYYSNLGYLILAGIIDKISPYFYGNYIKNLFLTPYNINNSGEFHRLKVLDNMADGYFYNEDGDLRKRCCDDTKSLTGAASMYSTVKDLSLWFNFLNSQTTLNGQTYLEKMTSTQVLVQEEGDEYYGYGLMMSKLAGQDRIFHDGQEPGYVSSMSFFPESGLEIIVLANQHEFIGFTGFNAAEGLSKDLAKLIFSN